MRGSVPMLWPARNCPDEPRSRAPPGPRMRPPGLREASPEDDWPAATLGRSEGPMARSLAISDGCDASPSNAVGAARAEANVEWATDPGTTTPDPAWGDPAAASPNAAWWSPRWAEAKPKPPPSPLPAPPGGVEPMEKSALAAVMRGDACGADEGAPWRENPPGPAGAPSAGRREPMPWSRVWPCRACLPLPLPPPLPLPLPPGAGWS
mmetsp:Transcript_3719/g.15488  ORF Transcript_3719/g.15488 Transcript_3719/m.15488 type:complete len:208 (-) Transcript_3719:356-979(-)